MAMSECRNDAASRDAMTLFRHRVSMPVSNAPRAVAMGTGGVTASLAFAVNGSRADGGPRSLVYLARICVRACAAAYQWYMARST